MLQSMLLDLPCYLKIIIYIYIYIFIERLYVYD